MSHNTFVKKKLGIEIEIVLETEIDHKKSFKSHTKTLCVVKPLRIECITGNS